MVNDTEVNHGGQKKTLSTFYPQMTQMNTDFFLQKVRVIRFVYLISLYPMPARVLYPKNEMT